MLCVRKTAVSDFVGVFLGGRPNPDLAGIPLRFSTSGSPPDAERIAAAAALLKRPVHFVDGEGYEQEIIAASPIGTKGEVAYVASCAKQVREFVDISIVFVVYDSTGREATSEVKSYNPYFGCDVYFLEWFGEVAVLIYREKHDTYIAASTATEPAQYKVIGNEWKIEGQEIGHWKYEEVEVRRLLLPQLTGLEALSEVEARRVGLCPLKHW